MTDFSKRLRQLVDLRRELGLDLSDVPLEDPDPDSGNITPRCSSQWLLEALCRQPEEQTARRQRMLSSVRERLIRRLPLRPAEIDRALLAMSAIPREHFVPEDLREVAYLPIALEIGHRQTISSPHVVAAMTAALDIADGSIVLDVGTGSGYQAAVLSKLAGMVHSLEIVPPLAAEARTRLAEHGFANVEVVETDGAWGHRRAAPFDAIVVAAGAEEVPLPLLAQLAPWGKLVMPLGPCGEETLTLVSLDRGIAVHRPLGLANFVPLTGAMGRRLLDS